MNWRDHIHSDPEIGQGKPIFRGTRFKVEFLLGLMGSGWDFDQIVAEYPEVRRDYLAAAAAFAAEIMHDEDYVAIGKARAA